MSDEKRFVVVVEGNGRTRKTFVFDGSITLDAALARVNAGYETWTGFSVHVDETQEPTMLERVAAIGAPIRVDA